MALLLTISGLTILYVGLGTSSIKILGLHLAAALAFYVYLPAVASMSPFGRPASLSAGQLSESLVQNWYLYVLYAAGLFVSGFWRDRTVLREARRTLGLQDVNVIWIILIYGGMATDIAFRYVFGLVISGSGDADTMQQIPYIYTSAFSLTRTVVFGLFCYASVLSTKSRTALLACAAYAAFTLITDGRRGLTLCIIAFFMLRAFNLNFKLNFRYIAVGAAALSIFVFVSPIFSQARLISLNLRAQGTDQISALAQGVSEALSNPKADDAVDIASTNIAMRGNAGVFFLTGVSKIEELQWGSLTWESLRWIIPSTIAAKPPMPIEEVIQRSMNVPVVDDATSVPLVFYADFGVVGVLVAGLYMGTMLYFMASRLANGRQFGLFETTALGAFFNLSFFLEADMTDQFVILRNLALVWLTVSNAGKFFSGEEMPDRRDSKRLHRSLPPR